MKNRLATLAAVFLSITTPSFAGFVGGDGLWAYCQFDKYACIAYIQGVVDAAASAPAKTGHGVLLGWQWCAPRDATAGQYAEVVQNWLRENPKERHFEARGLVAKALASAFPCR